MKPHGNGRAVPARGMVRAATLPSSCEPKTGQSGVTFFGRVEEAGSIGPLAQPAKPRGPDPRSAAAGGDGVLDRRLEGRDDPRIDGSAARAARSRAWRAARRRIDGGAHREAHVLVAVVGDRLLTPRCRRIAAVCPARRTSPGTVTGTRSDAKGSRAVTPPDRVSPSVPLKRREDARRDQGGVPGAGAASGNPDLRGVAQIGAGEPGVARGRPEAGDRCAALSDPVRDERTRRSSPQTLR